MSERVCGTCHYNQYAGGTDNWKYKCSYRFGTFDFNSPACSHYYDFQKAESSCEFCAYYTSGPFKWDTSGTCARKGKKVKGDSPSCSSFVNQGGEDFLSYE